MSEWILLSVTVWLKIFFSASQKGRRIRAFVSGEVHGSKQSYTHQWSSDMSRFGSLLHEDASRQSKHFPTAIPPPLLHHNDYILIVIFQYLVFSLMKITNSTTVKTHIQHLLISYFQLPFKRMWLSHWAFPRRMHDIRKVDSQIILILLYYRSKENKGLWTLPVSRGENSKMLSVLSAIGCWWYSCKPRQRNKLASIFICRKSVWLVHTVYEG